MGDSFNDSQEQTSNLEEVGERKKLDISFPGERKPVVDVPVGVDVPDEAHHYAMGHLHRYLQHRCLVPPTMILDPPCFPMLSACTMHAYLTLTKLDSYHDLKRHDIRIKPNPTPTNLRF